MNVMFLDLTLCVKGSFNKRGENVKSWLEIHLKKKKYRH